MRRILSGHFRNKGVTLITLIIAITIFGVFITVFSYIMIAKHESEPLYVQSTQAYAVAQAGIEYGLRYAKDDAKGFFEKILSEPPVAYTFNGHSDQDFGDGSFSLVYSISDDTLTSTGTVGVAKRVIIVQHFKFLFMGQAITLDPSDPDHPSGSA